MKLKNLAALLLRMFGALTFLTAPAEIDSSLSPGSILTFGFFLAGGVLVIFFSKKLGTLFCRGLEDEPPKSP